MRVPRPDRRNGVCPTQGIDTALKHHLSNTCQAGRNGVCPTQGIDTTILIETIPETILVEMEFARHRALTHYILCSGDAFVVWVEMEFARHRALTQS